jgi:hypothetical protein
VALIPEEDVAMNPEVEDFQIILVGEDSDEE